MNKRFVKVPTCWYKLYENNNTFIKQLGEKRFLVWFLLNKISCEMNMSEIVPIQIKQITNITSNLTGLSKTKNIKDTLITLKKSKLIECNELSSQTKPTDLIYIKIITEKYINDCENGFSMISTELFNDKIEKIDCIGFFIYCFLYKQHNMKLGNQDSGNEGYAECNRDFIQLILGISINTVTKYIDLIKKSKNLIKIIPQERYEIKNEFDETIIKWTPNRYIVHAKYDTTNKYHIATK